MSASSSTDTRKQLSVSAGRGQKLVFKSHDLKYFGKLEWVLKMKCICQPKEGKACFDQMSQGCYALNDDFICSSACTLASAEIYKHGN